MGQDTMTTTVGLVSSLAAKPQRHRSSTGVDSDSTVPVAAIIVSHDVSSPRTVDLTPSDSEMLLHLLPHPVDNDEDDGGGCGSRCRSIPLSLSPPSS